MLGFLIGAEHIEVEMNAAPAPGELTSGRGVDKKPLEGSALLKGKLFVRVFPGDLTWLWFLEIFLSESLCGF